MPVLLPSSLRAIVFDAVGTLIAPATPVAAVYAAAAARQGLLIEPTHVKERFHTALARAHGNPERNFKTDEAAERLLWRQIVADCLPDLPHPELAFDELWDHFGTPAAWRVFDDVGPALRRLRDRRLALAVASNFDARLRRVIRGFVELTPLYDHIIVCSEIGVRKPAAEFYRAVAARLGLPAGAILHVGDDPLHDVAAPASCGMATLLLDRGPTRPSSADRIATLAAMA